MEIRSLEAARAFTTKDGSTIRELFGIPTGGTVLQSLAESRLPAGRSTQRHYHAVTEEIYFILEGRADMELDGAHAELGPGDGVAIRPGAWHEIVALGERSCASSAVVRRRTRTRTPTSSEPDSTDPALAGEQATPAASLRGRRVAPHDSAFKAAAREPGKELNE